MTLVALIKHEVSSDIKGTINFFSDPIWNSLPESVVLLAAFKCDLHLVNWALYLFLVHNIWTEIWPVMAFVMMHLIIIIY